MYYVSSYRPYDEQDADEFWKWGRILVDRYLASERLTGVDNVTFVEGSGADLGSLDDASFDFVFSYITFQHIPDAAITSAYVREAGRVLKPGGYFYFQCNNLPSGVRGRLRLGRVKRLLRPFVRRTPGSEKAGDGPRWLDHPAWRGSRVSLDRIRAACNAGRMEIDSLDGEGTQYLWVKARRRS